MAKPVTQSLIGRSILGVGLVGASCTATAAAAADAEAGERKAEICVACHGAGGNSTKPTVPSLAAQPPLYIYYQLLQFREKRRSDPQMTPFAANLSDRDMQDLAAYFAQQPAPPPAPQTDVEKSAAGKSAADRNHCGSCHLPTYAGQNHIPRLAGQQYDYLLKQLRGFKTGARPDIDGNMSSAAQPLSDADIENLSHYLTSFK